MGFGERLVVSGVTCDVPLDLRVPVALPAIGLPLARVTVPERAVHEHGNLSSYERDVYPSARPRPVTAVPALPGAAESRAEVSLGPGVRATDARHDAASSFGRGRGRAERV